MMNNLLLKKQSGMTLTELLISTVLIGIVMVGVMSFSLATKEFQRSTNKKVLVDVEAATTLSHIQKTAAKATGNNLNKGIVIEPMNNEYLSLRVDKLLTPDNYIDDIWVIYVKDLDNHTLRICEQTDPAYIISPGSGSTPNTGTTCSVANSIILTNRLVDATFVLNEDASVTSPNYNLAITIETAFDPASAASLDNPHQSLTAEILSWQHSW